MPPSRLTIAQRVKRTANVAREVLSDLPLAIRTAYNARVGRRQSAVLVLTWRCTSRCQSCTAWKRPAQPESELTTEQWLQIGRKLIARGVHSVELFGGDVLLRKETLFPLVRLFHEAGCLVHMPTNCNLLDEPTARELTEHLFFIYLSMDGLGEAQDACRGTEGSFSRVQRALQLLIAARGDRPLPRLICNTTVSRGNAGQLEAIAKFARQMGFDEIHCEAVGQFEQDHVDRSHIGSEAPSPLYLRQGPSLLITPEQAPVLRDQLGRARKLAGTCNGLGRPFGVTTINIDVLSDENLTNGTVPPGRCNMERIKVIVDPFGRLVPCLFFDSFPVGDATNGGLDGDMDTPRRKLFRQHCNAGKLELCRHCSMFMERNRTGRTVLRRAAITGRLREV